MKRFKDACLSFQALLTIDPDNIQGLYNMGKTLEKVSQYTKAIACYDRIITLDGGFKAAKRRHKKASQALEEEGESELDNEFFRPSKNRIEEFSIGPAPVAQERILVTKTDMGAAAQQAGAFPVVPQPTYTPVAPQVTAVPPGAVVAPPQPQIISTLQKAQIDEIKRERRKLEETAQELEKKSSDLSSAESSVKKEMAYITKEKEYLLARAKAIAERGQQY